MYDILAQVMSMSRFRLAPKIGNFGKISCEDQTLFHQIEDQKPDYSHLPKQEYEWTRTVYGNVMTEFQSKRVSNSNPNG